MTDRRAEPGASAETAEARPSRSPPSPPSPPTPPIWPAAAAATQAPVPAPAPRSHAALWLAALLAILVIAAGASPFWAPPLAALLPWTPHPAEEAATARFAALEERLVTAEQRSAAAEQAAQAAAAQAAAAQAAAQAATHPAPPPQPAAPAPRFPILEQRFAGLEPRLTQLERRLGALEAAPHDAETLSKAAADKRADLEKRLAALEQRPDQAPGADAAALEPVKAGEAQLAAGLADLRDRLGRLEQRAIGPEALEPLKRLPALAESAARLEAGLAQQGERLSRLERQSLAAEGSERTDRALLVAVGQLRAAAASGRPFATELASVATLAQARSELAPLLTPLPASAAKGIPSLALLTQRFDAVADDILRADIAPASDDLLDQAWAKLRALVAIRRVDAPDAASGDAVERAVGSAAAALKIGDLAAAVEALSGLTGEPAKAARAWLDAARPRLAADAALARLSDAVAMRLALQPAAASGSPAGPAPSQKPQP